MFYILFKTILNKQIKFFKYNDNYICNAIAYSVIFKKKKKL